MAATLKVAVLIVKALVKPIANQLKQNAANPGTFRTICHDYGQFHNNILTRIQLRSQGHHVKNVKKLAESEAVTLGAEVFAEGMVLFVGMTAIGAEVYRKSIADQTAQMEKELVATQKAKAREMKAMEADAALRARLLRLEHQLISVEDAKLAAVHDELVGDHLRHMSVTEYLLRRVAALEAELRLRPPAPPASLDAPAEDSELASLIPLPEKMGPPLPMAAQDRVESQPDDATDLAAAVAAAGIDPLTLAAGTLPPVQLATKEAKTEQWPQHEHRHGHWHLPSGAYLSGKSEGATSAAPVIIDVTGEEAKGSDHSFAHPPALAAPSAPASVTALVTGAPPAVSLTPATTTPASAPPAPAVQAATPAPVAAPAPAPQASPAAPGPAVPDSRVAKVAAAATAAAAATVAAAVPVANASTGATAGAAADASRIAIRKISVAEARRRLVFPPAPGVSSEAEAAALTAAEAAKHTTPTLSEVGDAAVAAVPKVGAKLLDGFDNDSNK